MSTEMAEDSYTVSESARLLGLTPGRIRQMLSSGELEGTKDPLSDRWRVSQQDVLSRRVERSPASFTGESPLDAREWINRVGILERELGRIEGRLELTERAESTIREERDRLQAERDQERERADHAEAALEAERSKGFWARLFGE